MGVTLFDQKTDYIVFDVNFWHWRAIVEAIRTLGVLSESRTEKGSEPVDHTGQTTLLATGASLPDFAPAYQLLAFASPPLRVHNA